MAEAAHHTGQTQESGGFPPFKTESYPSQIFWLAITFAFLLVVMWRFVVPRIGGTIADRKTRIAAELEKAEDDRRQAEQAWSTYQTTLVEARRNARSVSERNRAEVLAESERAEAAADQSSQAEIAAAEARLARLRQEAKSNIQAAARDAAVEIVARLTGETVSADEAASAVSAVQE